MPVYETAQDIANEQQVIELLCAKWSCIAHKAPQFYPVDWSLAVGKKIKAMVEIKCRKAKYQTFIVTLQKFVEMCKQSEVSGIPYLLVCSWPEDGKQVVGYAKVDKDLHTSVVQAGRTDRGNPNDQGPHVEIPIERFKVMGVL